MGYDVYNIMIGLRVKKDNGPRQVADEETEERLRSEIQMLIDSDPDYTRIVTHAW